MSRSLELDNLKGILIFLVVLGHVMSLGDGPNSLVFKFCYSFHMFMFMFISGYLIGHKEHNVEWLKKRCLRLLVPFMIWGIFTLFFYNEIISFYNLTKLFTEPILWYLTVLYLCDVVLVISDNISLIVTKIGIDCKKSELIVFGFVFILSNIIYTLGVDEYHFKLMTIYYPYYFAGKYFYKYPFSISLSKYGIIALLYPLSMLFYGYKDRSDEAQFLGSLLSFIGVNVSFVEKVVNIFYGVGGVIYNHFIVAPLGCVFIYFVSLMIMRVDSIKNLFIYIGGYTLQIYILAAFFQKAYTGNIYIDYVLSLFLGITISIAIGLFISRSHLLNSLLFGSRTHFGLYNDALKSTERKIKSGF